MCMIECGRSQPIMITDETEYPGTAAVVRQFVGVQVTSIQSERLISATGRLNSKLRSP